MSVTKVSSAMTVVQPRNFIIDGDFTQWPEFTTATTHANSTYNVALWEGVKVHDGTATIERSTDVPTAAQAGHKSTYSQLIKCTGTDASIAVGQYITQRYYMTGTDFAGIDQQEVTISFWAKTSAQNSGDVISIGLSNSAFNRGYATPFTVTSSWTKFSHTVTLDTSGTWLYTEADRGLIITLALSGGTTYQVTDNNTWEGANVWIADTVSNFLDHTSNEFYITQFQIVLGSTAPTFTGEPIATVRDQVDFYVQRYQYDGAANETVASGYTTDTARSQSVIYFRREMRALPTGSSSTAGFRFCANACADVDTSLSVGSIGRHAAYFQASQSGTSFTAGQGGRLLRDTSDTCFLMFDARH